MRLPKGLFTALCCLLLLPGCAPAEGGAEDLPEAPRKEEAVTEASGAVLTIPLAELEPYTPLPSMEADTVGAETMGELLCGETLPGGVQIVCYWHPDHLTDPDHQYEKYWAVRQGEELLRFAVEDSGYTQGYRAAAFSQVLGQDGFYIEAPRGAAYTGRDYYVLDESGAPRLLMDCTNEVLERDINGDGVTELAWNYHDGQFVSCAFLREGAVYQAELMSLLEASLPYPGLPFGDVTGWNEDGLPVRILAGGWEAVNSPEPKIYLEGTLRLTGEAASLFLTPESLAWLETAEAQPPPSASVSASPPEP